MFHVEGFGAVGDGVANDTAAFEAASVAARAAGGGTVYAKKGTYLLDRYIHRHRVGLRGDGAKLTTLKASTTPTDTGLLVLGTGYVQRANIEGVGLLGNGNAGQKGIHFIASPIAPDNNGGWWSSTMRDVDVSNFDGDAIHLVGGGGVGYTFLLPHQFLEWHGVESHSKTGYSSLRLDGQVGQLDIYGGAFDGPGINEADDIPNLDVYRGSYNINFVGTSFQSRKTAARVDSAGPVHFSGCYWESLGNAVIASRSDGAATPTTVFVNGGNYSNAAHRTGNSGVLFTSLTSARMVVSGAIPIQGLCDKVFHRDSGSFISHAASTIRWAASSTYAETGGTRQIAVSSNAVTLSSGVSTYLVNASASAISTVTLNAPTTGTIVHLRAFGGTIQFASGGNIDLGGRTSPVTVDSGKIARLVKFDLAVGWVLESVG